MKNNKGISVLGIILIIISILILCGGAYYLGTNNSKNNVVVNKQNQIENLYFDEENREWKDDLRTYTDIPEFVDINKLISFPTKYHDRFVSTNSEVLYHIKGIDGFAVGYYNLYMISNEVKDYIWLDKGVVPEFSFQESRLNEEWAKESMERCKKGQTSEELKLQIKSLFSADKIVKSIEEFSKYYSVPESSITAYVCTNSYDISGKFTIGSSIGGPNNKFNSIIKPNEDKFDREKFMLKLNTEQPFDMKIFELKVD